MNEEYKEPTKLSEVLKKFMSTEKVWVCRLGKAIFRWEEFAGVGVVRYGSSESVDNCIVLKNGTTLITGILSTDEVWERVRKLMIETSVDDS